MTCPNESTNGIVIECQKCIKELRECIKRDSERALRDNWSGSSIESLTYTNASRNGEIAGYEWIIYKITGEHYSGKSTCINGIIEWDKFGNPTKTRFDKEEV